MAIFSELLLLFREIFGGISRLSMSGHVRTLRGLRHCRHLFLWQEYVPATSKLRCTIRQHSTQT